MKAEGCDNVMRLKTRDQVDASIFIYQKRTSKVKAIDQLELVFRALQLSPVAITNSVRARIPLDSTCHVHKVPVIILLFSFLFLINCIQGSTFSLW
jgi:hypothetical protein